MTLTQEDLTIQHFARIREFRRFSDGGCGLGLKLYSPLDEYLAEHGFLTQCRYSGGWITSHKGLLALETRDKRDAERRKPHNDLARRVGRWLERQGRLSWLNQRFEISTRNDSRAVEHLDLTPNHEYRGRGLLGPSHYISRPDVISINNTTRRVNYEPWIFEVKVSKRDFDGDVKKPQKRLAYALLAERIYYACPKGLIAIEDVPTGCGLLVETRKGVFDVLLEAPRCKILHSAHIKKLLKYSQIESSAEPRIGSFG